MDIEAIDCHLAPIISKTEPSRRIVMIMGINGRFRRTMSPRFMTSALAYGNLQYLNVVLILP